MFTTRPAHSCIAVAPTPAPAPTLPSLNAAAPNSSVLMTGVICLCTQRLHTILSVSLSSFVTLILYLSTNVS